MASAAAVASAAAMASAATAASEAATAAGALDGSPSLSLCATCLDRHMSARDLAALLLLGGPVPAIGES